MLESAELSLRRVTTQLLCAAMMPDDIVSAVRIGARRKRSRAVMLTRLELTCQAGYWLSRPEWADQLDQLDQVDALCTGTGFRVGTTIPGWLHEWYARKGGGDVTLVTNGVLDVWMALADDLERSADLLDPLGEERARTGMDGSIVLPSPRRLGTCDASSDPGD
ncbi:MAG: hypothetical protein QNJ12_23425 [Ilumatobacter sp.]|uniref:hypothetical protein n=1 Tax=Ilumatobacter sp. TaxID=1967498 RepID=UPI00260D966D|nr:hypothetical protein [Ilumatobacter sp.]MDJ0771757.1 hypothetical protein [Ilumatobacter sp.]